MLTSRTFTSLFNMQRLTSNTFGVLAALGELAFAI
jgi:hypothetical protein